ncbi:hypothetical protein [Spirosoma sp. KCTC 42546]|uniref:hypothetical protein n=1 Tax=Spirosoma sp. KCTC 42546 TaxID=2520506 RepID=UPI00143DBCEB|nr:hypothetical protein [Spirosoma sp. KCTC 42546]
MEQTPPLQGVGGKATSTTPKPLKGALAAHEQCPLQGVGGKATPTTPHPPKGGSGRT